MKSRPLLALAAAAGVFLIFAAGGPLGRGGALSPGADAPAFQLAGLQGGLANLSDYSGRVVLLDFWATWCDACKEEMPLLQSLHKRLESRGFSVVAVSVDEEGRRAVGPFVERHGLTYPILLADAKVKTNYRVFGLPTAYLIDGQGRIIRRYVGAVSPATLENDILVSLNRRKT